MRLQLPDSQICDRGTLPESGARLKQVGMLFGISRCAVHAWTHWCSDVTKSSKFPGRIGLSFRESKPSLRGFRSQMRHNSHILVTGAAGYLGSLVVQRLAEKGYSVHALDVGYFGLPVLSLPRSAEVLFNRADLRNLPDFETQQYEAVVHLASISNDPVDGLPDALIYGPSEEFTRRLAGQCRESGTHLIFPSSCSVYGAQAEIATEATILDPKTGYSRNKVTIEQILTSDEKQPIPCTVLRLATVYGWSPSMRFDTVINMLVGMALTSNHMSLNSNGEAWRPFVYIQDVVDVILAAVEIGPAGEYDDHAIVNVGREDSNSQVLKICRLIQDFLPESTFDVANDSAMPRETLQPLHDDRKIVKGKDERTYRVSFDKLRKSPLPEPTHSLEMGISKLIRDLQECDITHSSFQQLNQYRLQYLEYLKRVNMIDDSLVLTDVSKGYKY